MSNTAFVESQSPDPFVRELCRRAVRILNDQSLQRRQRERLIHQLQGRLMGHQVKQALETERKAAKAARAGTRGHTDLLATGSVLADQRQVLALSKEFSSDVIAEQNVQLDLKAVVSAASAAAANDGEYSNRKRSVLTLNRCIYCSDHAVPKPPG